MSVDYTTDGLVASIKRRGAVPTAQQKFSSQEFIDAANEEQDATIMPLIKTAREQYFVSHVEIPIVNGTAAYDIPSRAVVAGLRLVQLTDGSGAVQHLTELPLSQVFAYNSVTVTSSFTTGYSGYYLEGNQIILQPTPTTGGTLSVHFEKSPNNLVLTSAAGRVTAVNTGLGTLTLNAAPATFVTGASVDVIAIAPHFKTLIEAATVTVAGNVLTLPSVTDVSVGDWVALTGESPVPQIPAECHPLLAQATVVALMESLKDTEGLQNAANRYARMERAYLSMISPRVGGNHRRIVNLYGAF